MGKQTMTCRQRLDTVISGGKPDYLPSLGGWLACTEHVCALSGTPLEKYWDDPVGTALAAYRALRCDGLITIYTQTYRDDYRIVDEHSYKHAGAEQTLEQALEQIDAMPSGDEIRESFDMEGEYAKFRQNLIDTQARCGDMVYMPAQWGAGATITWYGTFGYELFFTIVGAHLDQAIKLMQVGGANGYNIGRLVARAAREGLYPHAVMFGEDICTQRGPMISPRFMEKYYFPELARGISPLLEAGVKPVWHSDGDIRPLVPMLLDVGIQGFQGFQPECGMTLDYVLRQRTREGNKLLLFGPLSVTTELPVMTPAQVRARVREAVDMCAGNADLVLFTANTVNPDVPLENIVAMYEAAREAY